MQWLELRARVEVEVADDIAAILARFSYGSPVIEQDLSQEAAEAAKFVTLRLYLPADRSLASKKRRLSQIVGHLSLIYPLKLEERLLAEEDWAEAWKAHFFPHRVGRRLVIKPSWREYQPSDGEMVIELDPGMAFGTGLHPTTRLCLQAVEAHLRPGWRALDLGTGSGIQALAAARLGASRVLALDTDPVAVKVARGNVRANSLSRRITVRRGSLPVDGLPFDLVVANIVAQVIQELAVLLLAALKPGGVLIAGGITAEKLAGVETALRQAGGAVFRVLSEGEWRTVVAGWPAASG